MCACFEGVAGGIEEKKKRIYKFPHICIYIYKYLSNDEISYSFFFLGWEGI